MHTPIIGDGRRRRNQIFIRFLPFVILVLRRTPARRGPRPTRRTGNTIFILRNTEWVGNTIIIERNIHYPGGPGAGLAAGGRNPHFGGGGFLRFVDRNRPCSNQPADRRQHGFQPAPARGIDQSNGPVAGNGGAGPAGQHAGHRAVRRARAPLARHKSATAPFCAAGKFLKPCRA